MTERDIIKQAARAMLRWEAFYQSGQDNYPHATAYDVIDAYVRSRGTPGAFARIAHQVIDAANVLRGGTAWRATRKTARPRKPARTLTEHDRDALVRMVLSGMQTDEVCRRANVSRGTIQRAMRAYYVAHGVKRRRGEPYRRAA